MPAHGVAACSTLAPEASVEGADADPAEGESAGECGPDAPEAGEAGLDRSSRARRLPKWQLDDAAEAEAPASAPSSRSAAPPTATPAALPAGTGPSVPPPPTGWSWPVDGEVIEVEVQVSDDVPPAWVDATVLQVLVDGLVRVRDMVRVRFAYP